jgi:ferrous iron transport protein B
VRTYALIGNPNAGKTTLFNVLTGTSQHVGNWPGVTVEKKEGVLKPEYVFSEPASSSDARPAADKATVVDLPGIYALSPYSLEERVSRSYIVEEKPAVVIDIVEATNIERNLYLTCQLAELGVPIVVAINMMDEAAKDGIGIDVLRLSEELGLPVVPITAVRGEGVDVLMRAVAREAAHAPHFGQDEHGHGGVDDEDAAEHIRDHHSDGTGRMNALVSAHEYHNHYRGPAVLQRTETELLSEEDESENAERRYRFIAELMEAAVTRRQSKRQESHSDKADKILTNRFLSIPIFLLIVFFMFHCTFSNDFLFLSAWGLDPISSPGVALQSLMESLVSWLTTLVEPLFVAGSWSYGLVIDGIFGGVGAVLSFLPQIMVLFFFLTLLEDVGYMSRAAFIMDRLLRVFGLSGKSFMPMLMGFGCGVPAMMACRTMDNQNDRKATLFLIPFMSCGARAPIFLVFASAFFPASADLVVFGLYLGGIVVAVITGLLLKLLVFKGEAAPLIIELPRYRAPRARSLGLALWATMKDYVGRAGSVIFVMSVIIWFFSSFGFANGSFGLVDMEDSLLALAGSFIAPVFTSAGFGFWVAAVALIAGFAAKEAVVGTLGVLCGAGSAGGLTVATLTAVGFTPLAGLSFMVFSLLYLPCFASLVTLARESHSWRWALAQAAYGLVVAWLLATAIFQVGTLLGF